jgi:hypothetical protein
MEWLNGAVFGVLVTVGFRWLQHEERVLSRAIRRERAADRRERWPLRLTQ